MSIATCEKLNTGFIERPLSWFKKGFTRAESKITGYWYSFSQSGSMCNVGYSGLCEKLGTSRASVWRTVSSERNNNDFRIEREGGKNTTYTYIGKTEKEFRVRTELYFYTDMFTFGTFARCLTDAEVDVLSLIYTWTRYEKTKKYEGNYGDIARQLGLDYFTVRRAVKVLFTAKLISRSKKGSNNNDKSVFVANLKRLRALERENKRNRKKAITSQESKFIREQNEIIDKRRAMELEREKISIAVMRCNETARAIPRFREIACELGALELKLAKAEIYAPITLPALEEQKKELLSERDEILRGIGLEAWQLNEEEYARVMAECKNVSPGDKGGGGA